MIGKFQHFQIQFGPSLLRNLASAFSCILPGTHLICDSRDNLYHVHVMKWSNQTKHSESTND
eukprot:UN11341